jgi:phosphoglycerate dehydrogenase-like enzyme
VLVAGRIERKHLEASSKLRAVIVPFAGVPQQVRELFAEFPEVALHNLHHNAAPTAEAAVGLLLAAAKSLVPIDAAFRKHDWRPRYAMGRSVPLAGKTALVLGLGAIGRRVARALRGLGMTVIATRRSGAADESADEVHGRDALADLLPRAAAVIVCLPTTDETTGLLGKEQLALLPQDAVLVNVARGPVVDEEALYEALRDRRLFAAGLDVWYSYPEEKEARANTPPSAFPFHELDNVVMSPHRAAHVEDTEPSRMRHLAELLLAAARGEEIPNRVDLTLGY